MNVHKINRIISLILFISIILLSNTSTISAASSPTIIVNNKKVVFNEQPKIVNGVLMVQVGPLADALNADMGFYIDTGYLFIKKDTTEITRDITFIMDKPAAIVDGKEMKIPVAVTGNAPAAFVPLNFVAQQFNAKISFNSKTNTYNLTYTTQQPPKTKEYEDWINSIEKGINPDMFLRTSETYKKMIPFYSHKYLETVEGDYFKNWGAMYSMTPEAFEIEMVRVGSKYANLWANANYKKIDIFENGLKELGDYNYIFNYLKSNVDEIKNNKVVCEGKFFTGPGMLIFTCWGNPVLLGTLRFKYSSPTNKKYLANEIVGTDKKPTLLNTWYEQDFYVSFYPEDDGLKVTQLRDISDIRKSKNQNN